MKRQYLCKPTPAKISDPLYFSKCFEHVAHLPTKVDLRPGCSPIVDQGSLGSCTANAIASGLKEYKMSPLTRMSRLFLYFEERQIEGTIGQDAGAMIGDGMRVAQEIGICPEADWPYDIRTFTQAPNKKDIADAAAYKLTEYHRVTSTDLAKAALAEGQPVVIGIEVYDSFESPGAAQTGFIPVPNPKKESVLGGHAVCVVGYDDNLKHGKYKGHFIVRNSWGTAWGDAGYFYLPYSFFKRGFVTDMWTGK